MKWNILPMIRKKRHQRVPESLQGTSDSRTLISASIAWFGYRADLAILEPLLLCATRVQATFAVRTHTPLNASYILKLRTFLQY